METATTTTTTPTDPTMTNITHTDEGLMEKQDAVAINDNDAGTCKNDTNTIIETNKTKTDEAVAPMIQPLVTTTLSLKPQPQQQHHRKLYILSLIQMYQNIYHQYITSFYKDMIWNMTKARRAMQSRSLSSMSGGSSSNHGTSATVLSVTHIPIHRTFHAQRRIFYHPTSSSSSSDHRPNYQLLECDVHGRTTHVTLLPPLTNEDKEDDEEEDSYPMENENNDDQNNQHTGLRQRRGRRSLISPAPTKLMMDTDDDNENLKIESETAVSDSKIENHMIQLLLLSSGTGMSSVHNNSHQSHLMQSQNKSIQMLQYIATIQTQLLQQLQDIMTATSGE